MNRLKVGVAAAVLALTIAGPTAGAAFGGEVTGSGKGGPNGDGVPAATQKGHASECAFSGLNDDAGGARVQNFGHRHEDPFFLEFIDDSRGASEVTVVIAVPGTPTVTIGCNKHAGGGAEG